VSRRLLVGAALLTAVALGGGVEGLDTIAPDPAMQQAIGRIAAATSEEELGGPLVLLKAKGGEDFALLVPQLLLFSMRATDVRGGMTAGVIVDRLHISSAQQLRAAAPYLATNDAALQRELRNLFDHADGGSAAEAPDFAPFAPLLRGAADPPALLVTYMLDSAPDQALPLLAEAYIADASARRALLADAQSADLARLAQHDRWWVRLYVAERMKQDPRLRTDALQQKLREDPEPAVRAAARPLP
jgi:hypothetical protein